MKVRSGWPARFGPWLLVVVLGLVGYVVAHRAVARDREMNASRAAAVGSIRLQTALADARGYVASLGSVLEGESARDERRFAGLVRGTAASTGLIDALWVQRVTGAQRAAYEREHHIRITRLVLVRRPGEPRSTFLGSSPEIAEYLPATYTSLTRPELQPGVDVSSWGGLPQAIANRANVFAVSASPPGSMGWDAGFYLVQAADYGRDEERAGYLAVFVPRGRLIRGLGEDPRRLALYLDGMRLEGGLAGRAAGSARFDAVGQRWRLDRGLAPATAWQSAAPWVALAIPLALAVLIWLIARGVLRRRHAEEEFERMFQISRDLLCIGGFDGRFKRINPAFERALGYATEELLAMPIGQIMHPDDAARVQESLGRLAAGEELVEFETRVIRADGVVRWLESNARPIPGEGVFYAASRDVTDRRRTERELESLALEQAALRRVATLVAQDAAPADLLAAVAREARALLGADSARLWRYDDEQHATVIATDAHPGAEIPDGTTVSLEGENIPALVWRSGRAARQDSLDEAPGSLAARARSMGLQTAAGAPIWVDGRLWAVLVAAWRQPLGSETGTEARLYAFTELVATAVSNATASAELIASRARIVTAGDEARQRIERNLHDGAQQQLIALGLDLQRVRAALGSDQSSVRADLENAQRDLEAVLEDIRELSRGLHPGLLARGGLAASLRALARRSPIATAVDVDVPERPPAPIETAVYYVASEALTNAIRHSQASAIRIVVASRHDGGGALSGLWATIADDGVGGAAPGEGSGLAGAADRVDALGGRFTLDSRPGQGTTIAIDLPLAAREVF